MNRIIEIYHERRQELLRREIDSCEFKKDLILDEINSSIRQADIFKAVIFLNSVTYQEYLNEISSLNSKLTNLREKEIKLTSFPFGSYNAN